MVRSDKYSWKRRLAPYVKNPQVLGVILIALVIPFTYYMVGQQTRSRQNAAAITTLANESGSIHGVADFHADTFESSSLSKWTTSSIEGDNQLSLTSLAAAEGSVGMQIKTTDGADTVQLIKTIQPTKEIYTRVKFKVIQKPPQQFMQHLFQLGTDGFRTFTFGIRQETATDPMALMITSGGLPKNNTTNVNLTPGQWYCIETRVVVNGTEGQTTMWVDGNQVYDVKGNNGEFPIDKITLGANGEQKVTEYHYDDFAADNYSRIGCGPLTPDQGPVRTNLSPLGKQPQGTTQLPMTLTTNTAATCKYDTVANTSYDQMANTFTSTGGTNHSVTLTNLASKTPYSFSIRCQDTSGKANSTDEKVSFLIPVEKTVSKPLTLRATYESISVYAPYEGDDNKNNTATFQYRKVGSANWIQGMEMTPDKREFVRGNNKLIPNTFKNQFRASILMAESGASYEVKVTYADTDGVEGAEQSGTVQTKANVFPSNGTTYYVAPPTLLNPSGSGDGSSNNPWRSAELATTKLNPGDTLLFKPGTYKERVYLDRSGTENNWITVRPETPLTIAQMKDPAFNDQKVVIDASNVKTTLERRDLCGAGNSNKHRCAFIGSANYIRISGFEIIGGDKAFKAGGSPADVEVHDIVFENNYIHSMDPNAQAGILNIGDTFGQSNLVHDVTIQGNEIISDRVSVSGGNIQFNAAPEGGFVVRNNRMTQTNPGDGQHGNDCINGLPNFNWYGGYGRDVDIYNNICDGATDEGIEIDGFNMNIRVWGNTITRANLGFSITPVYFGPVYVFRNTYSQPQQFWVNNCIGVKSGEGGTGHVYFYHNTFYLSDLGHKDGGLANCGGIQLTSPGSGYSPNTTVKIEGGGGTGAKALVRVKNGVIGGIYMVDGGSGYTSAPTVTIEDPAGTGTGATAQAHLRAGSSNGFSSNGNEPDAENVVYKNNIIMGYDRTANHFRANSQTPTMDYNLLSEEDNTYWWMNSGQVWQLDDRFAKWKDKFYPTYDAFKSGTGQEAHGINAKAQFVNADTNDLRLTNTSPGVNSGITLPGFNDSNSAWPAVGAAPDMGAFESGSTVVPPTPTPTVLTPTPTGAVATPTPTTQPPIGGVDATTTLALSPATASKTAGTTTTTNVTINTQNSVTNADLALTFNPAVIEVTAVTLGGYLTGAQEVTKNIDNKSGRLLYSFYTDSVNAKSGTGTIARITWRAKAAGTSTVSFDPSTTIVYGTGTGNTIASGGLSPATYTVTGVLATPTPTVGTLPTATTQPTATPIPTTPCSLSNARWSTTAAGEGELVTLTATTNGSTSCVGKQVAFEIRENDSAIEGGLDDNVSANPQNVTITGSAVSATWNAEWHNDCGGFCNPNEFYFNAQIVGQSGTTIRSAEPYLTITESSTPIYTLQVQLNKNVTASTISGVQISINSNDGTITKTITLNSTSVAGVYAGPLPLLIDPGTYTMYIKAPGYLVKKYTISITSGSTAINLTSVALVGGDVNNDNVVNTLDLGKIVEDYSPQIDTTATSDITKDKRVNALDLGIVIENYFKRGDTL